MGELGDERGETVAVNPALERVIVMWKDAIP